MKKAILLFAAIAALALASCDIVPKGGTIEVTNGLTIPTYVIVVKGSEYASALEDVKNDKGTLLEAGAKTSKKFDKNGFYTVVAVNGFYKIVSLTAGNTEKVTIE